MRALFFLLIPILCLANPPMEKPIDAESSFVSGVGAYQKGEYENAKEFFKSAALQQPNNEVIFYNWGLSELKLENWGWATALLRKALTLSPSFKEAQKALQLAIKNLPASVSNYEPSGLASIKANYLKYLNWNILLFLGALFLLISGVLLLAYFGKRKTAFFEEEPLPPFPTFGFVCAMLLIVSLFCIVLKSSEQLETKATLVTKTANLRTGPSPQDTVLFEVFEGQDLLLLKKHEDWLQVQLPGGVKGWLPNSKLFLTTESRL